MTEDKLWELAEDHNEPRYAIAAALLRVAYEIKYLGNGNAATQMGALEAFGVHLGEKMDAIVQAMYEIQSRTE
jgi:hypothetical protein